MNYIELINNFWRLNKEHSFTANETQVYLKLLDTCNSLGWKNPFSQSNLFICAECSMSEPTLIRVRNSLKQFGLIEFESGKIKRQFTKYSIIGLNNFSLSSTLSVTLSDTLSVTLSDKKSLDNIKQEKLNKTKEEREKKIPAPENDKIYFIPISEIESFMSSDQQWLEVMCMQNHLTEQALKQKVKEFTEKLRAENVKEKHKNDCFQHFSNWLRYPKPTEKTKSNITKLTGQEVYEQF